MPVSHCSMAADTPPLLIRVENHVLTAVLDTPVNLMYVARELAHKGSEYNPKKFSAVILRAQDRQLNPRAKDIYMTMLEPPQVRRPPLEKVAVLVFHPGKLVCTGAKSEARAVLQLRRVATDLRSIGYKDAFVMSHEVHNIVGRTQLPINVDQETMQSTMPLHCTFDPALFPGAILRHPWTEGITLLVFASGKIIVTGAKTIEHANRALARIAPVLMCFDAMRTPEANSEAVAELAKRNAGPSTEPASVPVKTEEGAEGSAPRPESERTNSNINRTVAEVLRDVRTEQASKLEAWERKQEERTAEMRDLDGESPLKRQRR